MLSHTLGTFLPAVKSSRLATFPGPSALCPQPSSLFVWVTPLVLQLLPGPQAPRGAHLPDPGALPPEARLLGPAEASSANSMWPEKLFLPFGNLLTGAGSDQLPGKEFSRTSSQREKKKKENIPLTYAMISSPLTGPARSQWCGSRLTSFCWWQKPSLWVPLRLRV